MIWKKQPVGSKLEELNSNIEVPQFVLRQSDGERITSLTMLDTVCDKVGEYYVELNATIRTNFVNIGLLPVGLSGNLTFRKIGNGYYFLRFQSYSEREWITNIYNGVLKTWEELALYSKTNYIQKSGTSTYLTSYNISYIHCGNMCVFSGTFTPNTNISSSTGAIDNCGLPKPLDGINVFPVSKNNSSFGASDISGRNIGIYNAGGSTTSATFKAVGAYTSGESYSFSGAYVTSGEN